MFQGSSPTVREGVALLAMAQSLRRDSHAQRSLYGCGEVEPISVQAKSSIGSHELNARDISGRDRAGPFGNSVAPPYPIELAALKDRAAQSHLRDRRSIAWEPPCTTQSIFLGTA